MSNYLSEVECEVDNIVNDNKKYNEFCGELVNHCYNMLNEDEKKIYNESTKLFDYNKCVGIVLSMLQMKYLDFGFKNKEDIIKAHSQIYKDGHFVVDEVVLWTVEKILNLKNKEEEKHEYC